MSQSDYIKDKNHTAAAATILCLAAVLHLVNSASNQFGYFRIVIFEVLTGLLYWCLFFFIRKKQVNNEYNLKNNLKIIRVATIFITAVTVILMIVSVRILFNDMDDYYRTICYIMYFIEVIFVISVVVNQIPMLIHIMYLNNFGKEQEKEG